VRQRETHAARAKTNRKKNRTLLRLELKKKEAKKKTGVCRRGKTGKGFQQAYSGGTRRKTPSVKKGKAPETGAGKQICRRKRGAEH